MFRPDFLRLAFVLSLFLGLDAFSQTALLLDKKTNQLHVSRYEKEGFKVIKTYHATLGQVKGDKVAESDLKTPEGIYFFKSVLTPPHLQKQFGAMGLSLNFPNPFDMIAGRTGSAIMLHATDEPLRLTRNYDSKGCVVVHNEEILEIRPFIRLGLTPILIFSELTPEYFHPEGHAPLVDFFKSWVESWKVKDLEVYMNHYHSDFMAQGKDKNGWKAYKSSLNRRYQSIEVRAEDVFYYRHPNYSVVSFTQVYKSYLKSGAIGHQSRGTKILYVAEENTQLKIISETYSQLMW